MWRKILFPAVLWSMFLPACSHKDTTPHIEGRIIGLKKGTVYLNRLDNDSLIKIDSFRVKGDGQFRFDLSKIDPQLLVITVKEIPEAYLAFFSDDTVVTITSLWNKFGLKNEISGGKNQRAWVNFNQIRRQMNDRKLDVLKAGLEARKDNDSVAWKRAMKQEVSLMKRFKLYAYQFAVKNADKNVGAYVAWREFKDNRQVLDSIYKKLSPSVKKGPYGLKIKRLLGKN